MRRGAASDKDNSMAGEELDALLGRMTQISSAVNAFKSESVQQAAFEALVSAFQHGVAAKAPMQPSTKKADTEEVLAGTQSDAEVPAPKTKKRSKSKATGGGTSGAVTPVRDLDLRPKGLQSFDDFIALKQPKDNQERFAVAVYYLEQIAGISGIGLGHMAAVFKQTAGWREPQNVRSGVQMTAHRKNTIDSSDFANLRTTPHGRNFVEHDLPAKSKAKK